jgi:hypothetical protein
VLLECSFSKKFWWAIGFEWCDIHNMVYETEGRYPVSFMMEILISGCWILCDQRNDYIFNGKVPSVPRCIARYKSFSPGRAFI